jgi:SPX domain protein involved in polyphosphate accumulation
MNISGTILGKEKAKCFDTILPHSYFDNEEFHIYFTELKPGPDIGRNW